MHTRLVILSCCVMCIQVKRVDQAKEARHARNKIAVLLLLGQRQRPMCHLGWLTDDLIELVWGFCVSDLEWLWYALHHARWEELHHPTMPQHKRMSKEERQRVKCMTDEEILAMVLREDKRDAECDLCGEHGILHGKLSNCWPCYQCHSVGE